MGQPRLGKNLVLQSEYLFPTGLLPTVLTETFVLVQQFPGLEEAVQGILLSQENKK